MWRSVSVYQIECHSWPMWFILHLQHCLEAINFVRITLVTHAKIFAYPQLSFLLRLKSSMSDSYYSCSWLQSLQMMYLRYDTLVGSSVLVPTTKKHSSENVVSDVYWYGKASLPYQSTRNDFSSRVFFLSEQDNQSLACYQSYIWRDDSSRTRVVRARSCREKQVVSSWLWKKRQETKKPHAHSVIYL